MLELRKVSYEIDGKKILNNIDVKFKKRKLYVITGQNGSGKSTLAKIIMGIIQPNAGAVYLNDENISSYSISERANMGMAIAFQQPTKFKSLTVRDLFVLASPKGKTLSYFCTHLSNVGLCAREYLDRKFNDELSGGERKRIEIALALATNAGVTIFDEPEAGIDLWSYETLYNLFENNKNRILIIISHQERIIDMADELIVVKNGKILTGSKKELKKYIFQSTCAKLS